MYMCKYMYLLILLCTNLSCCLNIVNKQMVLFGAVCRLNKDCVTEWTDLYLVNCFSFIIYIPFVWL